MHRKGGDHMNPTDLSVLGVYPWINLPLSAHDIYDDIWDSTIDAVSKGSGNTGKKGVFHGALVRNPSDAPITELQLERLYRLVTNVPNHFEIVYCRNLWQTHVISYDNSNDDPILASIPNEGDIIRAIAFLHWDMSFIKNYQYSSKFRLTDALDIEMYGKNDYSQRYDIPPNTTFGKDVLPVEEAIRRAVKLVGYVSHVVSCDHHRKDHHFWTSQLVGIPHESLITSNAFGAISNPTYWTQLPYKQRKVVRREYADNNIDEFGHSRKANGYGVWIRLDGTQYKGMKTQPLTISEFLALGAKNIANAGYDKIMVYTDHNKYRPEILSAFSSIPESFFMYSDDEPTDIAPTEETLELTDNIWCPQSCHEENITTNKSGT